MLGIAVGGSIGIVGERHIERDTVGGHAVNVVALTIQNLAIRDSGRLGNQRIAILINRILSCCYSIGNSLIVRIVGNLRS